MPRWARERAAHHGQSNEFCSNHGHEGSDGRSPFNSNCELINISFWRLRWASQSSTSDSHEKSDRFFQVPIKRQLIRRTVRRDVISNVSDDFVLASKWCMVQEFIRSLSKELFDGAQTSCQTLPSSQK